MDTPLTHTADVGAPARPYSSVLFDLDGTIADSAPGVVGSVQEAFARSGLEAPPLSELMTWLGPPMLFSLCERAGLEEETAQHVLTHYRAHYDSIGLLNAEPYPGVRDVLLALNAAGVPLAIATSKPEGPARAMLDHLELTGHFAVVRGAMDSAGRSSKRDVLAAALDGLAEGNLLGNRPAMIGDRHHDIGAAVELGVASIFATWGYGTVDEAAGASAIATTPLDLIELLLG
ncbi:HAD hydrolase-like protein [Demequina lutea]|uniref:Phosphoglycolate phosphatase n=1 Tax=Demequina lutea TaxID=431489 RepID=A0A7Y9ZFI5_9MICO|nr:HAD hydrolase-like protein [Demequina lutea]NYI42446.1 phosphoglycolate phosphatase [Demequina lutea]